MGLLIVTGGNEVRAGAWNGQARFAARIAGEGFPVLRFDRRGTGDSEGENRGFRHSAPDIAAALAAFRATCGTLDRVAAFGNCDAASALMLAGGAGFDGLILSNPWTYETDTQGDGAAASARSDDVRRHYRARLADPAAIRRLLTGKVSFRKLLSGLRSAAAPTPAASTLVADMRLGMARFDGPLAYLVAERDRTGQAFLSVWDRREPRIRLCPDATHSYVEAASQDWLAARTLEMLRALS